jgi:hypothetical protein
MAEKDSDVLEVLIRQIGENAEVNPILGKTLRVLGHAELIEPVCNRLHHSPGNIFVAWTHQTGSKAYPKIAASALRSAGLGRSLTMPR